LNLKSSIFNKASIEIVFFILFLIPSFFFKNRHLQELHQQDGGDEDKDDYTRPQHTFEITRRINPPKKLNRKEIIFSRLVRPAQKRVAMAPGSGAIYRHKDEIVFNV
jgi:hypothetical protein